jgi:hypothetical protein
MLCLNYSPPLYHYINTPADRIFTGTVYYSDDYAYYVSVIQQGMDGNWTVKDKYTSEPHDGTFMHFHYLLLGKIGNIFHFSPITTYHLSRLILGCLFFILVMYIIEKFLPKEIRKIATLLTVFSTSWPLLNQNSVAFWSKISPMFNEPNPVVRFATQPHFLIGAIFSMVIIIYYSKLRAKNIKIKMLIPLIILTFYCALTDPAQTITMLGTIVLYDLWNIMRKIREKEIKTGIKQFMTETIPLLLSVVIPLFYLRFIRNLEPWKTIGMFDSQQNFPYSIRDFLLAFGPTMIFVFLGCIFLWKNVFLKKTDDENKFYRLNMLLISWIVSTVALIFVFSAPLSINRLRIFHTPLYIAFGIIGAYGIYYVSNTIQQVLKQLSIKIIQFFIIFFFGLISIPVIIVSFNEQINFLSNTQFGITYPPKTYIKAYEFLKNNSNHNEIVLCMYEACNQIPYFSGNTAFIGNITGTLNEKYKSELTRQILSGSLTPDELEKQIKIYDLKYFFVGYQESVWQTDFAKYPFLKKVYSNDGATIWEIISNSKK